MYHDEYKATVKDNNDPKKLGRVRCHCPSIMGEDSPDRWLGWAMPKLYFSSAPSSEYGSLNVPEVGATVWVSFEQGNPEFPIYDGGWPTGDRPSDSSIPALAKGESDGSEGEEREVAGVTVPASEAGSSTYPFNRMFRTKAGHIVEIDDTEGNQRIRLRHASGTFFEMRHDGSVTVQALKDFLLWADQTVALVADTLILGASTRVKLGDESATLGVARLTDTTTNGSVSATVQVGMVPVPVTFTYTPPGGGLPQVGPTLKIQGKINSASEKVVSQ